MPSYATASAGWSPPDVAADFALLIEAFSLVADSIGGDAGARVGLDQRAAEFDAADENLEPFMRDVCGLDFGD
jgi:hypothetical protein